VAAAASRRCMPSRMLVRRIWEELRRVLQPEVQGRARRARAVRWRLSGRRADRLLPDRGRPARRAQRAHPGAASERGLAALHDPLRCSGGRLAPERTARRRGIAPTEGGRHRCRSAAARPARSRRVT